MPFSVSKPQSWLSLSVVAASAAAATLIFRWGRKEALKWALENVGTSDKPNTLALMVLKYLSPRRPRLYDMQEYLPKLPLPSVQDTMRCYLDSVQSLLTEDQFRKTKQVVNEFVASKESKELQDILIRKRETEENWMADWWLRFAYLSGRDPLVINVTFSGFDCIFRSPPVRDQALRATGDIVSAMQFYYDVRDENVPCLRMNGVVPVDMDGYRYLFGTTRDPGVECDEIKTFHVGKEEVAHIIVTYGSAMYKVEVQHEGGSRASFEEIYAAVCKIKDEVETEGLWKDPSVPTLTTENRSTWASIRDRLKSFSPNDENLEEVDRALFMVALHEEDAPDDLDQLGSQMFKGDGKRIWYDKSINFLCFANGVSCHVVEHSFADAPIASHLIERMVVYERMELAKVYEQYEKSKHQITSMTPCNRLRWHWDNSLENALETALSNFHALSFKIATRTYIHRAYGKEEIKTFGHPPDAFVQAALQLTSLRYHGTPVLTYESASTRAFKLGRTETIRSATSEAVAFAQAMLDPSTSSKRRQELLSAATRKHRLITKLAMQGKGVDRHLIGLKLAAVTSNRDIPEVFKDPAYTQPYRFSTSQTPLIQEFTEYLDYPDKCGAGGLFGPTAEPGIGCSYHVMKHRLYFHMSARSLSPERDIEQFKEALIQSLSEMEELCSRKGTEESKL